METNILFNKSEVNVIMVQIKKCIRESEKYEDYVRRLNTICCGPQRKDGCLEFTKLLSSEEFLISLLNLRNCRTFLKDNPGLSLAIVNTLLELPDKPWDIICSLFSYIINSNFSMKQEFIKSIWNKKDSLNLPPMLASMLIKEDLSLVENQFLKIYNSNQDVSNVWMESSNYCFVVWCCWSNEIFYIVSSVLNQFLIFAKSKNVVLKLIEYFIVHLVSECEQQMKNVVYSYPLKHQCLVSLLTLEPEANPCREYVINKLQQLQIIDPSMALLFLSHFPVWINILNSNNDSST